MSLPKPKKRKQAVEADSDVRMFNVATQPLGINASARLKAYRALAKTQTSNKQRKGA